MLRLTLLLTSIALSSHSFADNVPYLRCFEIASTQHQVQLDLLIAVAAVESNFDPDARSPANAHGIMQVRWPLTARHLGITRLAELYNPCVNIERGAAYLAELLDRYRNNTTLALAAYNYGPSRISRVSDIPKGVWTYIDRVQMQQQKLSFATATFQEGQPLNEFDSYAIATAYHQFLENKLPSARLSVEQGPGKRFSVNLQRSELTVADALTLSRMMAFD